MNIIELTKEVRKKLAWQVLLFVGPPLAGKGTQAARLSELLGMARGETERGVRKDGRTLMMYFRCTSGIKWGFVQK